MSEIRELERDSKPIMFMCYMGAERSVAIQKVYMDKGIKVDIFDEGTRRLCKMEDGNIKKEIGDSFVYLIYDQGSQKLEYTAKIKATELLERNNIDYQIIDTASLRVMAYQVGGDIDDYLV